MPAGPSQQQNHLFIYISSFCGCQGKVDLEDLLDFSRQYIDNKVTEWSSKVHLLPKVSKSQPHAAYCALPMGSLVDGVMCCVQCMTFPCLFNLLSMLFSSLLFLHCLGYHHLMILFRTCLLYLLVGEGLVSSIPLCNVLKSSLILLTSQDLYLAVLVKFIHVTICGRLLFKGTQFSSLVFQ